MTYYQVEFPAINGVQSVPKRLKERTEYFEEVISGYEDLAHVDDLRGAYGVLKVILEEIAAGGDKDKYGVSTGKRFETAYPERIR